MNAVLAYFLLSHLYMHLAKATAGTMLNTDSEAYVKQAQLGQITEMIHVARYCGFHHPCTCGWVYRAVCLNVPSVFQIKRCPALSTMTF